MVTLVGCLTLSTIVVSLISAGCLYLVPVELWFVFARLIQFLPPIDECLRSGSGSLEYLDHLFAAESAVGGTEGFYHGKWVALVEDGVVYGIPDESGTYLSEVLEECGIVSCKGGGAGSCSVALDHCPVVLLHSFLDMLMSASDVHISCMDAFGLVDYYRVPAYVVVWALVVGWMWLQSTVALKGLEV